MNLLGSTENKITRDKHFKTLPQLGITEVALVHCNIVTKIQQDSKLLYTFVNKSLTQ